tara:strand:- start:63 stop:371 length:309 start_codon:yes stop_codon:yes gene_type:complete
MEMAGGVSHVTYRAVFTFTPHFSHPKNCAPAFVKTKKGRAVRRLWMYAISMQRGLGCVRGVRKLAVSEHELKGFQNSRACGAALEIIPVTTQGSVSSFLKSR